MKRCLAILALCAAACGPDDKPQAPEAKRQLAENPRMAQAWPLLLQHCLRLPSCDPMGQIGEGTGEASGQSGGVFWFVRTADAVVEGAQDHGASIHIVLPGPRGQGGEAGRPMAISEMPATLRARRDRNSWAVIEYRTPGGAAPEPRFLTVQTAHLALTVPDAAAAKTRAQLTAKTSDWLDSLAWPDGERGARIELIGRAGVLFGANTSGLSGKALQTNEQVLKQGFEPWVLFASRNLRDEPLPGLIAALMDGESLSLKASAPGGVILSDAIYSGAFASALERAASALDDPEIARTIGDRCERFSGQPDSFWKLADVTPALDVCDPRTPEQKIAAERGAPVIGVAGPSAPDQ